MCRRERRFSKESSRIGSHADLGAHGVLSLSVALVMVSSVRVRAAISQRFSVPNWWQSANSVWLVIDPTPGLRRSALTKGASRKIHKKLGMNLPRVGSSPPRAAATIGDTKPAERNAAIKPRKGNTMIGSPGVVCAMPGPSSLSRRYRHRYCSAAACATPASGAYVGQTLSRPSCSKTTRTC
ncbi:MAG: hypothetical protein KatS3mg077_1194 [Candidatus Binatia bacterium]|nr:MAG: hypothetical protein KatS3mg077_1194 [Candidatus Binatia bacterium]